ncbi:hypothetical protein [Peribacillus simplex]|uniref:Uncharacterized protein n=1 Tax=Peribacillus simplex NBRC 15720 = DSM 1321 TaxID=1349754 RepID=A0A223EKX2_9BACI|nr:hypothetical protein [Peribacillus simplex]ASS95886.1 hypothetical protein BS1321_19430 [Peribacillus simplex NBRC 15720 = DSM 1321]MEC1396326.1 hypothetical protein [Peribacillus simplex]
MDNEYQYYHGPVNPINQQHGIQSAEELNRQQHGVQSADEFNRQQQGFQQGFRQGFRQGYREGFRAGQQAGFFPGPHQRQLPSWPNEIDIKVGTPNGQEWSGKIVLPLNGPTLEP